MEDDGSQTSPPRFTGERVDRISKRSIEEVSKKQSDQSDKTITIYYRPSYGHGLVPFIQKFSRSAAITFSKSMANQLGDSGSYVVLDGPNMKPYKHIFDWISTCVNMGNDEKFPDLDATDLNPLNALIDVVVAAHKLRIPEGSLNMHLKKRLFPMARKHIIDLERVRRVYDSLDADYSDLDLREIASTSIFEAWWRKELDGDQYQGYMCELSDMRKNITELDHDLHQAVVKKYKYISEQREKKKRERQAVAKANCHTTDAATSPTDSWNQANMTAEESSEGRVQAWDHSHHIRVDTSGHTVSPGAIVDNSSLSRNSTNVITPTSVGVDAFTGLLKEDHALQWDALGADTAVSSWADEMNEKPDAVVVHSP